MVERAQCTVGQVKSGRGLFPQTREIDSTCPKNVRPFENERKEDIINS